MKTVQIKSEYALNYIKCNGIRYHPPKNSKLCCWEKVEIVHKDTSGAFCKWIIVINKCANNTEIWRAR